MGLRHLGFAMAAVRDCIWRIFSVLIIVLARGRVFVPTVEMLVSSGRQRRDAAFCSVRLRGAELGLCS